MGCRCYMLRRTPADVDRRQSRALSPIVSTLMVSEIEIHYPQSCLQLCFALTSMCGLISGYVGLYWKSMNIKGGKCYSGNRDPTSHEFESSMRISLYTE
jgi:hypothetical protein